MVGVAPHSLRAVTPEELSAVAALAGGGPIHIHVAEQLKEVEDCVAWSGARPVEWLLANAEIDQRWCLIHATHMTEAETDRFAASGAVAGLCPITEANLGDGVFDARRFLNAGGRFGIGSDSNVLIGVADELRQLEYSQRLARRERNVLGKANGSTGRRLFDEACAAARRLSAPGRPALRQATPPILFLSTPDIRRSRESAATPSSTPGSLPMAARSIASGRAGASWSRAAATICATRPRQRFAPSMTELVEG